MAKFLPDSTRPTLKRANDCFEKARGYAEPEQADAIGHLIRFYQTGDYAEWVAFGTKWVQNDATVDFDNGFIEVYRDCAAPRAARRALSPSPTSRSRPR